MKSPRAPVRPEFWVLLAVGIGTLAKLYCAGTTLGTDDTILFRIFGRVIAENGLPYLYRLSPEFNHTPLVGYWAAFSWVTGGDSVFGQPFLCRLPGILADVVTALVLLRLGNGSGGPLVAGLFALNPGSLIVSGFHGNVDSVLIMFLVLSAAAARRGDALRCGVWLGLATQIKIVALLAAPVLFFALLRGGCWRTFAAGAYATVLAGWAYPLVACPVPFLSHVLGYGSYWGLWGITWWLRLTGLPAFARIDHTGLDPAQTAVMTALKAAVIAGVLWIAWRFRHRRDPFPALAGAWAWFFAFAPGAAPQYYIWPAPFLLVARPVAALGILVPLWISMAISYTAASGGVPWFRASFKGFAPFFAGHAWADLAWIGFVLWAVHAAVARPAADDRASGRGVT